jgi:hypothetical protein
MDFFIENAPSVAQNLVNDLATKGIRAADPRIKELEAENANLRQNLAQADAAAAAAITPESVAASFLTLESEPRRTCMSMLGGAGKDCRSEDREEWNRDKSRWILAIYTHMNGEEKAKIKRLIGLSPPLSQSGTHLAPPLTTKEPVQQPPPGTRREPISKRPVAAPIPREQLHPPGSLLKPDKRGGGARPNGHDRSNGRGGGSDAF